MKKKASTLKKVTIAAVVLLLATMVLELIFVRALKFSYEAMAFMPVRLVTLVATNLLGGCIFTKSIKVFLFPDMDEGMRKSYKKLSIPVLWVSAILVLADCVKDSLLNPGASTVSAALVATYMLLTGVCALIILKNDPEGDKVKLTAAAVIVFIFSALALTILALSFSGDIYAFINR